MKKLRWQLLIVVLALTAIAVLLLGRQPVIQSVAPEPTTGGVYTEGLVGGMGRLNPLFDAYNQADRDVNRLVFSSLIRFDGRGIPYPDLAESWGISQDGTVFNFVLRPDVQWHDGRPVTTADIEFTIQMMRSPDLLVPDDVRAFWDEIEVRVLDESNLQFILPEPFAPFLDYLTFGVLPDHLLGDREPAALLDDPFNLSPIGSGPYRFERFLTEANQIQGVVLTAFEDYYEQRPFIDQVVFRYYSDSASAMAAYQEGEIQGLSEVSPEVLPEALVAPDLDLYSGRLPHIRLVLLNLDNPQAAFLQEVDVRKALLSGLNRQKIVDRLLDGQAIVAESPIFPGTWASFEEVPRVPFDSQAAIELLKEAGYTIPAAGGQVRLGEEGRLEFDLYYPEGPQSQAVAQAIQSDWARIGVAVTPVPMPLDTLLAEHLATGDYAAAVVELDLSRSPDPDPYLFWHETQMVGGQNFSRWDNRQASEYLEQARITMDLSERARLYRNFQVIFSRELPALPLYYPVYTYALDEQLQGVRIGPLFDPSDRFNNIEDWFLLARRTAEEIATPSPTP